LFSCLYPEKIKPKNTAFFLRHDLMTRSGKSFFFIFGKISLFVTIFHIISNWNKNLLGLEDSEVDGLGLAEPGFSYYV